MSPLRKKRLEASIQREMARLIMRQQTKDDRIEFVSVHAVELASDMSRVKVYLSFFGSEENRNEAFHAICEKRKEFQTNLGRNLKLRLTPQLKILQQAIDELRWETSSEN